MVARIFNVAVAGIGTYSDPDSTNGNRIAHRDGTLVRYVDLAGSGTEGLLRVPLAQDCELADELRGALVDIDVDVRVESKVAYTREGREYVASVTKLRGHAVHVAERAAAGK